MSPPDWHAPGSPEATIGRVTARSTSPASSRLPRLVPHLKAGGGCERKLREHRSPRSPGPPDSTRGPRAPIQAREAPTEARVASRAGDADHTSKAQYQGEQPAGPSHEVARVAPIPVREHMPGGAPEREYSDTRGAGRLPVRLEPWRMRSMPLLEAGPAGPEGPELRHPGNPRVTCRRVRRS